MRKLSALIAGILLILLIGTAGAFSASVQLFSNEAEAQKHCPADTIVWVNTPSGVYHFRGERWYANTKNGAFVCRKEGDAVGYRATRNGQ